jgi:hypothetical protein
MVLEEAGDRLVSLHDAIIASFSSGKDEKDQRGLESGQAQA